MSQMFSMTDVTGRTFHSLREKCEGKLRPSENGLVLRIAIWRTASISSMPIATMQALLR